MLQPNRIFLTIFISLVSVCILFQDQPFQQSPFSILQQQQQLISSFTEWKQTYAAYFSKQQQPYRKLIYYKNLNKIIDHNKNHQKNKSTYKMGINQFMIFSQEEFVQRYLLNNYLNELQKNFDGRQDIQVQFTVGRRDQDKIKQVKDVQPIDWAANGKVSRVKNQGTCGSCYAFSTTGLLQSNALIVDKESYDFSQQQIIDCSSWTGNQGCNGGRVIHALQYVRQYGLATTSQYPYAQKTQTCIKNGGQHSIQTVQTFLGCDALIYGIQIKPISAIIQATNWQQYQSGIFNNCASPPTPNHWVLLTGIDKKGNWKIKNSWGATWGEKGFIRVQNGNICGICTYTAFYPI